MTEAPRSRVVEWEDPTVGAAAARTMSGLEYIQALLDGSIPPPPIVNLMNMTMVSAEVGTVTFTCEPNESHYNPIGTVHGGLVCTLLDSVAGCAVQTTLPKGQAYTSLEIKVNYLRPVLSTTGTLTAVGTVTDSQGRLVATASSTLLVFPVE
jgi:uncharacterized protein (TIGR00369 family)